MRLLLSAYLLFTVAACGDGADAVDAGPLAACGDCADDETCVAHCGGTGLVGRAECVETSCEGSTCTPECEQELCDDEIFSCETSCVNVPDDVFSCAGP